MDLESPHVFVMRCDELPVPHVPSTVVQCGTCGADCWLSAATGPLSIAAAKSLAPGKTVSFLCRPCLGNRPAEAYVTESALREAIRRQTLN